MLSLTSVVFLSVGVVMVVISLAERWVLVNWYLKMSESSWHFWGLQAPYIRQPEGIKEFAMYRSKLFFFAGVPHLVIGIVVIAIPDSLLLSLVWCSSIALLSLYLRAAFIDKALDINRRYSEKERIQRD